MTTIGTFTTAGLSAAFTPPIANQPFSVQMGPGTGIAFLTMATVASPQQSDFALMFWPDGTPIGFYGPGSVQINPPFSALPYSVPGTVAPSFQLACKVLLGGSASWAYQFNQ